MNDEQRKSAETLYASLYSYQPSWVERAKQEKRFDPPTRAEPNITHYPKKKQLFVPNTQKGPQQPYYHDPRVFDGLEMNQSKDGRDMVKLDTDDLTDLPEGNVIKWRLTKVCDLTDPENPVEKVAYIPISEPFEDPEEE